MINERKYDIEQYFEDENTKHLSQEQKEIWIVTNKCLDDIIEILLTNHNKLQLNVELNYSISIAAYLLSKTHDSNIIPLSLKRFSSLNAAIEEHIMTAAKGCRLDACWSELVGLTNTYPRDIFERICSMTVRDDFDGISGGIIDLAIELLQVQENDAVAEYNCGNADFSCEIKDRFPSCNVVGFEKDSVVATTVAIRESIGNNKSVVIKNIDPFSLACSSKPLVKYDRIFSPYIVTKKETESRASFNYYQHLKTTSPELMQKPSDFWLNNVVIKDSLATCGRAVSVTPTGVMSTLIDETIRQQFVEEGMIEAVILLPVKTLSSTNISLSMMVFSHNNTGVRFVDASSEFHPVRRMNDLTEEDVEKILSYMRMDSDNSVYVENDVIRNNDYSLNVSRYLGKSSSVDREIELGKVIHRITRGVPKKAEDIDRDVTVAETDIQYLMTSNIQNGIIDQKLPCLSKLAPKDKRYCLSSRNIVLAKNGFPFKVAIAEPYHKNILASGNLYVIEVDEEQINPYYLGALLTSEYGQKLLLGISSGTNVPALGVEQLKKMIIPLPDMDVQQDIATHYMDAKEELLILELKMQRARNKLGNAFDERRI